MKSEKVRGNHKEDPNWYNDRTGKIYSSEKSNSVLDPSVTCPGNILSDISRLEVLIGGTRAGNNSVEIINIAADICRRLFTGGIMDIGMYRELIDELMKIRDTYG